MPAKKQNKQTKNTETGKKQNKNEKTITEPVVQHTESVMAINKTKKSIRKAGRTLLIKSMSGSPVNPSIFDGIEGIISKAETKTTSSYFLTFDTIQNALDAFRKLRTINSDYIVKFSYYRIFFTITGLSDTSDYNQTKQELINFVNNATKSDVLYCRFYRKDNKYLGSGDFTIDTLSGMSALIAKEGGIKNFSFGSYNGTFYRYNGRKDKSEESIEKQS